jgi:SOS-response transcriptional repressor LexA/DNA-binding XRE family transcriptional regulator
MRKLQSNSKIPPKPDWATSVFKFRQHLNLSQNAFGQRLHCSAMAISRWERGTHEPSAGGYIELGNLAGTPLCWYFWGRAGLRTEDLMRVMPKLGRQLNRTSTVNFQIASAGSGLKTSKAPQLVAIPLQEVVAASHGEKGGSSAILYDAPVESVIAAPQDWCPNPSTTTCVRVRGNSMRPLIHDGYILAVDSSQIDPAKLNGKVVIAWHKDMGLTVSRLQHYNHTDVLQSESREYESIVLDSKHKWKILAKVLWWIGNAP